VRFGQFRTFDYGSRLSIRSAGDVDGLAAEVQAAQRLGPGSD
jgi:hypothetical protein